MKINNMEIYLEQDINETIYIKTINLENGLKQIIGIIHHSNRMTVLENANIKINEILRNNYGF